MAQIHLIPNEEDDAVLNGLNAFLQQGYIAENPPEMQALSVAAHRLLARGAPINFAELADAAGLSGDQVSALFKFIPQSAYEMNDRNEIAGFVGLSVAPANHEFIVGGRKLYTWCVFDALFLPEILQADAKLKTRCPHSGQEVALELAPGEVRAATPVAPVMSILNPDYEACCADLRGAFCDHVNLFASEREFAEWAQGRNDVARISLDVAMILARQRNQLRFPDVSLL